MASDSADSKFTFFFPIHLRAFRYFLALVFSATLSFAFITVHTALFPPLPFIPDYLSMLDSVVDSISRTRAFSPQDFAFANAVVANARARPRHLQKFWFYDATARLAGREIAHFIEKHHVPIPLFPSRHPSLSPDADSSGVPRFCVGVMSARRPDASLNSVAQAVHALLARMGPDDMCMKNGEKGGEFYIHVFNVDEDPETFLDIKEIEHLVPVSVVKNRAHAEKVKIRKHHETLDYVEMLRILHGFGCPYATLIEDDAMPDEDWTGKMREAADLLERTGKDWILTRLYTNMVNRVPPKGKEGKGWLDTELPRYGCVAMMYNRDHLLRLADDLEEDFLKRVDSKEKFAEKDLAVLDLFDRYGIPQFAFYPVIFQHTGVYSSVQERNIELVLSRIPKYSDYFQGNDKPVLFDSKRWTCLKQIN